MRQTFALTSTYSSDEFGICSALYELGGMVVMHDASGCNSTYTTHDEPRWYTEESGIYISAISQTEAIMGNDDKLIADILETAQVVKPKFIAVVGAPIPYMIGTDFRAIERILERETNVPCFGFRANGMQYYTKGVHMALKEFAKRFCLEGKKEPGKRGKLRVNILGATPLDLGVTNTLESLKDWIRNHNAEIVTCMAMGATLEEMKEAGQADLNLVVSYGGLGAAKVLKERFGIPYVAGIPFDGRCLLDRMQEAGIDPKKRVVLIGEQVYSASLGRALVDCGYHVTVLCPLDVDKVLLEQENELEHMEIKCAPQEDDLIKELSEREVGCVIADPLYRAIAREKKFIELPHTAFSGRMYEAEIPDMIGEGSWLWKKIENVIEGLEEQEC